MITNLNKIFKLTKCCSYCGSLFPDLRGLCGECEWSLNSLQGVALADELETIYWLYTWVPEQSNLLSKHLHTLKGQYSGQQWSNYAYLMVERFRHMFPKGKKIVVTYPPSKSGRKDHAYYLAESVAKIMGAELFGSLQRVQKKTQDQKKKNVHQRREVEFRVPEKNSVCISERDDDIWLFVDDVLTTGATNQAVKKALGNPKYMYTWVLARRIL